MRDGAEGGASECVQAVDQDEGASQVLPTPGDGVLHLVQAQVELLDHIPIAVPYLGSPCYQKVICRLPHGLERRGRGREEERRRGEEEEGSREE